MPYKKIKTHKKGYLKVGDGHKIYYEISGNPKGQPVLFVHGGPGGGCSDDDKIYFNPRHYKIITFDQRGAGKSKPFASIKYNTTSRLVKDMRKLLAHLGEQRVILFGGSWGSTLSLVYAIRHPETVSAMVVRGIFLGGERDDKYFVQDARMVFPEAWEELMGLVPGKHRDAPMKYYYRKMQSKNKSIRDKYTKAWATYEFSISKLKPNPKKVQEILGKIRHEAFSLIEMHYLTKKCFLPDNYILDNIESLNGIPLSIVHGRYDHVCSPLAAWELKQALPDARLFFTLAGHSAHDPENELRLTKEMDRLAKMKIS